MLPSCLRRAARSTSSLSRLTAGGNGLDQVRAGQLAEGARVGGDHRQAGCHRVEDHLREALGRRREDEQVCRGETVKVGRPLGDVACERHPIQDPEHPRAGLQLASSGSVPEELEGHRSIELRQRLEQRLDALSSGQAPRPGQAQAPGVVWPWPARLPDLPRLHQARDDPAAVDEALARDDPLAPDRHEPADPVVCRSHRPRGKAPEKATLLAGDDVARTACDVDEAGHSGPPGEPGGEQRIGRRDLEPEEIGLGERGPENPRVSPADARSPSKEAGDAVERLSPYDREPLVQWQCPGRLRRRSERNCVDDRAHRRARNVENS
jgi:hypothetical protein